MATVTRESIGNLHEKWTVRLQKDDYYTSFEKSLKNYSKNVVIPGFRKGNVPAGMIRKMYGQSIFIDEVIRTANSELEQFIAAEKPEIFAQPVAVPDQNLSFDMNSADEYNFEFEIGLKPTIDLEQTNNFKGKLTQYKIEVNDTMLNNEIENIQRRAGKLEDQETIEQDNDILYASYQLINEDGSVAEEKTEDVATLDNVPKKLAELVKGKSAEFTAQIVPAEICSEEELDAFVKKALRKEQPTEADKTAKYQLTITKVGRLVPRELNEEFFAEVFPNKEIKDEASFKEAIKAELDKEVEKLANDRLQNEIFETLVHETQFELPNDFLRTWLKRGGEQEKTDEEVEKEFGSFEHSLRWTIISEELIKKYDVNVSMDEVMEDVKAKVMAYFGMQSAEDVDWLDSYMEKMKQEKKTIDETYRRLLFDKLFSKIAEEWAVPTQFVSEEEYSKLPSAGHHHH